MDYYKSNKGHWVEPQTVDFYTADLYLILLLHHDDNFSRYYKKIVTDYSINAAEIASSERRNLCIINKRNRTPKLKIQSLSTHGKSDGVSKPTKHFWRSQLTSFSATELTEECV